MEGNYDYDGDGNGNGNGNNPYPSYPSYQFQLQPKQQKQTRPSRLGLRTAAVGAGGGGGGGAGEIVEVQGGHIVRSIGRKDRHSKVCTAKGPRDRRVRLSAHTAIQFYDVQDRLGYDRPSKAVDWLIKKAKAAIDELDELPAWKPSTQHNPNLNPNPNPQFEESEPEVEPEPEPKHARRHGTQDDNNSNSNSSGNGGNGNNSIGMHFQNGFGSQNQDLKLSLQSFPGPIPQIPQNQNGGIGAGNGPGNSVYYDGSGWAENGGLSGFGFNTSPQPAQTTPFLQPLFGQPTNNQLLNYISQRGPLQSSNTPPVRAWIDPVPPYSGGTTVVDPQQTLAFHQYHPFSIPGFSSGGFSGFRIPARIQGDDEEHDGISDKPSSASSDSRH